MVKWWLTRVILSENKYYNLGVDSLDLLNMSIKQYCELLGSSEPAPGGGSTAALAGALAASLTMMVVNLSIGKKSFEAQDEGIKDSVIKEFDNIKKIREDLYSLIDEDTKAFNMFMEAMRLPKETEEEKAIRNERMQQAAILTLNVPMATMEKCYLILKNQKSIATYGNKNAVSDVGVGCHLALTGLEGALLNVNINLPGIKDETVKSNAKAKRNEMLAEAKVIYEDIMAIVNSRIG